MPDSFIKFFIRNRFIILVLAAVALGFIFSGADRILNPGACTSFFIVVILFFNMGLTLASESIGTGLSRISFHIYLQSFIFIICPLYFFLTSRPFGDVLDGMFLTGILALSVLPTTVSSCSVFTSSSGGNTAGTIFNATLSNMAGIIISPLLLSLIMREAGGGMDTGEVFSIIFNLVKQIIIPFTAGQLLRRFAASTVEKHRKKIGELNDILISIIVFFAISKTASDDVLVSGFPVLIGPFLYLGVSHIVLIFLARLGGKLLKFDRESMISITYAAPQKTMAMGIPLLSVCFASRPDLLSVALLPLVFYHPWQLIVAGFVQNRLGRKYTKET